MHSKLFLFILIGAGVIHAADWTNPAGGDWNVGTNWSSGVPDGSLGRIALDGTYTVTVDSTPPTNPTDIRLQITQGDVTLHVVGGTLSGNRLSIGLVAPASPNTVSQVVHVDGGVLNLTNATTEPTIELGSSVGTPVSSAAQRSELLLSSGTINVLSTSDYAMVLGRNVGQNILTINGGLLNIQGGGRVQVGWPGSLPASAAIVQTSGTFAVASSYFSLSDRDATGTFDLSGDARFVMSEQTAGGDVNFYIANQSSTGSGTMTVSGSAQVKVTNGDGDANFYVSWGDHAGTLLVNGGSVITDNFVTRNNASTVQLNSGHLSARYLRFNTGSIQQIGDGVSAQQMVVEVSGTAQFLQGVTVASNGELRGAGGGTVYFQQISAGADVVNQGVLAPGSANGDIGVFAFQFNGGGSELSLTSNSVVQMNLSGVSEGEYDQILISSGGIIYGGNLVLNIFGALEEGDSFQIFAGFGSFSGAFDSITSNNGYAWEMDYSTGWLTLASVPEPSTSCMIVAGVGLLALRRRRCS